MGEIYLRLGDIAEALRSLEFATRLAPSSLEVRNDLANALYQSGQVPQAIIHWEWIVQADPMLIEQRFKLAKALVECGRGDDAIRHFSTIVSQQPSPNNLTNLGAALFQTRRKEEAVTVLEKALALSPNDAQIRRNMASAWRELGEPEKALVEYRLALALEPNWALQITAATLLPIIYDSIEHLQQWRSQISDSVSALLSSPIELVDPYAECRYSDFYLAYQGQNNRSLKVQFASLFRKACPKLNFTAAHCNSNERRKNGKRIRIGFVSAFFADHPIGKMVKGFVAKMDKAKFELFIIQVPPTPNDDHSQFIQHHADHVVTLRIDLWHAMKQIADLQLDAILYYDIGMHPFSYHLAFARLAPVQLSCFGHPETTGIDSIDYILSTDYWEPVDAEEHYCEQLLRLKDVGLPAYYYRHFDAKDFQPTRTEFGLPENAHLYLCPQTAFKFHPDFDETIGSILEQDPLGIFVCVETRESRWTEKLRTRFSKQLGALAKRIVFLPRQKEEAWPRLLASVDVAVDTPHFSGMITTLDILSMGTPLVTWPGEFSRGRQTAGIYQKMGITSCTAASQRECADLAVLIATNPEKRQQLSDLITERLPSVFEDTSVIEQFESFLDQAVRR